MNLPDHSPDPAATAAAAGFTDASRIVAAQYAGGRSVDDIDADHQDVASHLLSDAQTREGRAYAREYAITAASLVADLRVDERDARQASEPGGTPHPDPRLAARGWQRCADDCGVYVRRAPVRELEAG